MGYGGYDLSGPTADGEPAPPTAVKILIAGGFGAGKTTMVGAITEIRPLRTEESLSQPGAAVDVLTGVERKRATTVAMDFGRITIHATLVVYLFGMPGQERFWFMWDDLSSGALGAVVLADTRRLDNCFPLSTTSNGGERHSSSRSTTSTTPRATPSTKYAAHSTSTRARRSSCATLVSPHPAGTLWSPLSTMSFRGSARATARLRLPGEAR